jgi:mycoredoxin
VLSSELTIYSTTWCGYCKRLMRQLDTADVLYKVINIEEDPASADIVEKINGGNQTVPTVLFSDGSAATNPSALSVIAKLKELEIASQA